MCNTIKGGGVIINVLFTAPKKVSEQEVRDRINYFVSKAAKAEEIFEYDKTDGKMLAKEIRDELKTEYDNNNSKAQEFYSNDILFKMYKSIVHKAFIQNTGLLDKDHEIRSFLYDVQDYMNYHFKHNEC